jgi:hypothetical protein
MFLSRKSNGHLMRKDNGHLMLGGVLCRCQNKCWIFTIEATTPYIGSCLECESWNYPVEYNMGMPLYPDCIISCTGDDYGFPVSFCLVGGQVYIRASLESAPPCVCGDCPFYIPYALSTPLTLDVDGCPVDGTYTLSYDGPTIDYPDDPCGIPTIEVTIAQIACCDGTADGSETPYFVSFDVVTTMWSAAGTITDCNGTGGTQDCTDTSTYTDLQLDPQIGQSVCYRVTSSEVTCIAGSMSRSVFLINNAGTWELHFGDLTTTYPSMISIGAATLSPVGTYPDVASCEFDANYAHNTSITNIVVTL